MGACCQLQVDQDKVHVICVLPVQIGLCDEQPEYPRGSNHARHTLIYIYIYRYIYIYYIDMQSMLQIPVLYLLRPIIIMIYSQRAAVLRMRLCTFAMSGGYNERQEIATQNKKAAEALLWVQKAEDEVCGLGELKRALPRNRTSLKGL